MTDIPITIIWLIVSLSFIIPMMIVFVSKNLQFIQISLIFIGAMWFFIFILADRIELEPQTVQHLSFTNSTVTTDAVNYDLTYDDGNWNPTKVLLILVSIMIAVIPIVMEVKTKRSPY